MTRQYVLRSEDQGQTWTLLPGKRPGGWFVPEFDRMDELRPISLGGGRVLALATDTGEGHLWSCRSDDDGKTWTTPKPTTLVHPDAPPMLFRLADGKTLVAFHHNVHPGATSNIGAAPQVWVSPVDRRGAKLEPAAVSSSPTPWTKPSDGAQHFLNNQRSVLWT